MHAVEQFGGGDCRNCEIIIRVLSELGLDIELIALPSDQHARIDQRSHGDSGTAGSSLVAISTALQKAGSGFGNEWSNAKKSVPLNRIGLT